MNNNKISDEVLWEKIQEDNTLAYDTLFERHYENLCYYSNKIVSDNVVAEDIVQELFIKIWENRENISINNYVKAYLYRSVYNRSINYIRDNKNINASIDAGLSSSSESYYNADNEILYVELELKLFEIIDSFPEKQKAAFLLKRFDNYSYKEIAEKLEISEKMVGKYLSKSTKKLREALYEYKAYSFVNAFFFLL